MKKTSGVALESLGESYLPENDEGTVSNILKHYENYPSVSKIIYNQNETLKFDFPTANVEDINKRIKSLKIGRNVIDSHLTNIINRDIKQSKFSEDAKTVLVRPLKNDGDKIENYRPVSIKGLWKILAKQLIQPYWKNTLTL